MVSRTRSSRRAKQPWTWPLLPTPTDSKVAAQHRPNFPLPLGSIHHKKRKPKPHPKHYILLSKYMYNGDAKSLTRSVAGLHRRGTGVQTSRQSRLRSAMAVALQEPPVGSENQSLHRCGYGKKSGVAILKNPQKSTLQITLLGSFGAHETQTELEFMRVSRVLQGRLFKLR